MALILQVFKKNLMVEKQFIKDKEVWIKVTPLHVQRDNPNIIPTEYFTASYFFAEPNNNAENGEVIKDDDGEPKLFESPVAALSFAGKRLKEIL